MDGDRRGLTLRCLAGKAWVTQPGDRRDHALAAGNEFKVTRSGRVVVEALSGSAVLNYEV